MDIKSSSVNFKVKLTNKDMAEAVRLLLNKGYGHNIPEGAVMSFQEVSEGPYDVTTGFDVHISTSVSESKIKACLG